MAATKWRRDLYPAEKKADLIQLEESWDTVEVEFVDALTPVIDKVVARLFKDIKDVLISQDYIELKYVKIGFKDKVASTIKTHMYSAFRIGKTGAQKELNVEIKPSIGMVSREYISVKADIIATDFLEKIKTRSLFIALNGIKAGHPTDKIMNTLNETSFEDDKAEDIL